MGEDGSWTHMAMLFLLWVLPWFFVAAGAWMLFSTWKFLGGARTCTGTVVEVHKSTKFRSSSNRTAGNTTITSYRPVFEYQDGGETQRAETATYSTRFDFPTGSEHEILINPASLGKARMPGMGNYVFGAALLVLGLLFGIVGILAPV